MYGSRAPALEGQLQRVVVKQVTKLFGATPALRGVSLDLVPGSATLLSGENGAGKSTLLNIIGTQLRPTRGKIVYFDGENQRIPRRGIRAQLGWVSHASHCYGELTGRQNIELVADLQGVPRALFQPLAARVGLGKFAERPVSSLSRGQTQRIALARALIHQPALILLDEPWTGLDRQSAQLLENIVREEVERGAVVVIVSHEQGLAERLGAREVRISRGKILVDSSLNS